MKDASAYQLADYLNQHIGPKRCSLAISENSIVPASHRKLKELASTGNRRSTLRRIIRQLVRKAEGQSMYLVFNGSAKAVPQQDRLLKNIRHILSCSPTIEHATE